jgi:hypothetical protein
MKYGLGKNSTFLVIFNYSFLDWYSLPCSLGESDYHYHWQQKVSICIILDKLEVSFLPVENVLITGFS